MRSKNFFIVTFLFFSTKAYTQPVRIFSEEYLDGKVTYQYYEDKNTSEQVKHGIFKYTKHLKYGMGNYSENIIGSFRNGFRNGPWSFSIIQNDYPNSGETYTTENTTSIQTFKDGIPNGVWRINSIYKVRERIRGVWQPFSETHIESASTIFINGNATGVTTYNDPRPHTNKLNNKGFFIGNHIFSGVYDNTEMSFNLKGIVTKFVTRDRLGKVTNKINIDPELLQITDQYISGQINKQQIENLKIKIDTVNNVFTDYKDFFEQERFTLHTYGGDKSYVDGESQRIYGRYIFARRIN